MQLRFGPYGPPPPWGSPSRGSPAALASMIVVVVVIVVVLIGFLSFWLSSGGMMLGAFAFAPILGMVLFIVILVIAVAASAGGFGARSLPPPPPIQQPMVPAGMQGPIALNCPNCGAPPEAIDRFGVATCTHCATRFLVR